MPIITAQRVEGVELVLTVEVRVPVASLAEVANGKRKRLGRSKELAAIRKTLKDAVK